MMLGFLVCAAAAGAAMPKAMAANPKSESVVRATARKCRGDVMAERSPIVFLTRGMPDSPACNRNFYSHCQQSTA
jgi:hypothetical protein